VSIGYAVRGQQHTTTEIDEEHYYVYGRHHRRPITFGAFGHNPDSIGVSMTKRNDTLKEINRLLMKARCAALPLKRTKHDVLIDKAIQSILQAQAAIMYSQD
jgi:hypothetical protein